MRLSSICRISRSLLLAISFAAMVAACSDTGGEVLVVEDGEIASQDEALMNTGGGLSYTCTKNPLETPTCSCSGVLDCLRMVNSGVCGKSYGLVCPVDKPNDCSCNWVQKTSSTSTLTTSGSYNLAR